MKKISLSFFILYLLSTVTVFTQQLSLDDKVRYGKLPNGLTYYIRYNKLPEQRVDFHIAQKVGSILEQENQRGLAHFLEHMAFNGTKNFPNNQMKDYLEKNGIKFGENLNAYTSIDETVYMIKNVPTTRDGLLDSCLLILHDWSNFISLEDNEIDKERGVIKEEWRTRNNARSRMFEKILPEIYGDDLYGHRLPIGLMDVVENFKYDELREYYHKWYRPDLQGIIIVGDIDVDKMENQLKSIFADVPNPVNPAKRIYFPVTDNKNPIISIVSDVEATDNVLYVFNKQDAFPEEAKSSPEYLIFSYINMMCSQMIDVRFQEITKKKDSPFVYASAGSEEFFISKTKDAWTSYAQTKDGKIEEALRVLLQETKRAKNFGFTQTEYDRVRADFFKELENAYQERDKEKNSAYTQEYIRHFLDAEPAPGIEFEYYFYKNYAEKVPIETINQYFSQSISDENVVIVLMMPEKKDLAIPSQNDLLNVLSQVESDVLSPYEDKRVDSELIKKMPKKKAKVISKTTTKMGETEWQLSNGVKVQFKTTDFKKDQILMSASSLGGTSLLDEKHMPTILLIDDLITLGGLGNFSSIDLNKALAGKKVVVKPSIDLRTENFSGSSTPADFETMLQLIYLYLTQPRSDKEMFESYISRLKSELKNYEANPKVAFVDTIHNTLYNKHVRAQRIKPEMLDLVNYELAMDMYKKRFLNADEFIFTFVGNINPDSVQSLIEKYLGALPKQKQKETFVDVKMYPVKGIIEKSFERKMETEKSSIFINYTGVCDYSLENRIKMDMLSQIMDIIYIEKIREDEGGTYGVKVRGSVSKYPFENFNLQISFDTNTALKDKLLEIVYQEINQIMENGPSQTNLYKVKEFMLKKIKEQKAENAYWLSVMNELNFTGLDKVTQYEEELKSINIEDIKLFSEKLFKQGNKTEIMMNPEK